MPETRSSGMHIRVNPEIKTSVEPILTAIGLSFSDVFNLTLRQIYLKRRIPFELSSIQLTENGYTPEFEAEILAEAEECYAAVANGTAKLYKNAAELRAELDAEDDDDPPFRCQ
jgi:addiction module RelB/DinJ family antitoxin